MQELTRPVRVTPRFSAAIGAAEVAPRTATTAKRRVAKRAIASKNRVFKGKEGKDGGEAGRCTGKR